jgi:hypothetical protein
MAQQPYQQRPQQYQRPVAPGQYPQQQYAQQQYGQQQYPQQGGPGGYMRPKSNTTAWILGVMCLVFFAGFIAMLIMYLMSAPQAQQEVKRANKAVAELGTAKDRVTQLERLTGGGSADISKEQLERQLSGAIKTRDLYWRALSTEQQDKFRNTDIRIDACSVDHGGRMAHVTLSNGRDKKLLNVEVKLVFWKGDVPAYVQPELITSIPARTKDGPFKKQYDFPIKREGLNPGWEFVPEVESGGTEQTNVVE